MFNAINLFDIGKLQRRNCTARNEFNVLYLLWNDIDKIKINLHFFFNC